MTNVLTTDLYRLVIQNNAEHAKELIGITGFISSRFLTQQLEKYPNLIIKLYVGMTVFGMTESEHLELVDLSKKYQERLTILYKKDFPANHMKIYEFRKKERSQSYLGSANFSANGFGNYIESMTTVELRVADIIDDKDWIDCRKATPKIVVSYPPEEDVGEEDFFIDEDELQGEQSKPADSSSTEKYLLARKNLFYFSNPIINAKQKIQLMRKSDSLFDGINSMRPHIPLVKNMHAEEYFPRDTDFELWFEKRMIKARLGGDFSRQLIFIDPDISKFLHQKMNMEETEKITYAKLLKHGLDYLYLDKVSDNKFIASLSGFFILD